MADEVNPDWELETIPSSSELYKRLHESHYRPSQSYIVDGVFKNATDSEDPDSIPAMSTDWCEYTTPSETRCRGRGEPQKYAVFALVVRDIATVPEQSVVHTPIQKSSEIPTGNRSHTDVRGPKSSDEVASNETLQEKRITAQDIKNLLRDRVQWRLDFDGTEISEAPKE